MALMPTSPAGSATSASTAAGDRALPALHRRPAALMGIINCTPDSFSDGGSLSDVPAAVAHARRLVEAGAEWLDVGGESSRPGAEPVSEAAELARVAPVVAALARALPGLPVSVDTAKSAVARAALGAGAVLVNDITAGGDPAMFETVAAAGAGLCLMHMRGSPRTMQDDPRYHDVLAEVVDFLAARVAAAEAAGIPRSRLVVDPGIGFGKTLAHNLALLRGLDRIEAALGLPILVGLSRKRLLVGLLGRDLPAAQRDHASHLLHVQVVMACDLLRVHDVAGAADARACCLAAPTAAEPAS